MHEKIWHFWWIIFILFNLQGRNPFGNSLRMDSWKSCIFSSLELITLGIIIIEMCIPNAKQYNLNKPSTSKQLGCVSFCSVINGETLIIACNLRQDHLFWDYGALRSFILHIAPWYLNMSLFNVFLSMGLWGGGCSAQSDMSSLLLNT